MKYVLLGCPFDNGIRSMLCMERGIIGAADAPDVIIPEFKRKYGTKYEHVAYEALELREYNLEVKREHLNDQAFQEKQNNATQKAHEELCAAAKSICKKGCVPFSVGGDHSITYALAKGVSSVYKKMGLIYIDAHFDMRPLEEGIISSGNSFYRLIEEGIIDPKNIIAIGIHRTSTDIFSQMEKYAQEKGVTIFYDDEIDDIQKVITAACAQASAGTDGVYLSIDIDAVNKKLAPGVSAPAEKGLSGQQLFEIAEGVVQGTTLIGCDIAEVSSRELAWFEIAGEHVRTESAEERAAQFAETAALAIEVIQTIVEANTHG